MRCMCTYTIMFVSIKYIHTIYSELILIYFVKKTNTLHIYVCIPVICVLVVIIIVIKNNSNNHPVLTNTQ